MINFRKAGLLILTLVIPALVFVLLKLFATNHYDLPYYHPQLTVSGEVEKNNGDTIFYKVPYFTLKKTDGQPYTEKFGNGNMIVANYLPQVSDDNCKMILGQVERISALTGTIPNLKLITLTKDWKGKKTDYPASFDSENWQVLIGSADEVDSIVKDVLKLETKVPKAKTNSLESKLVLVDIKGHVRGYYNLSDLEETDRLMGEIKILNYEKKSN